MGQPEIEIFRAGTHTASDGTTHTWSDADVAAIAAAYDPAQHEAPVVIGHPADDAPAYGWIAGLRAAGGRLVARLKDLDDGFRDLVRRGRFKKISAAFYGPAHPASPSPGVWSLRHVGFLGATPPAVKGLRPVALGEDADQPVIVTITYEEAPVPDPQTTDEIARLKAELDAQKAENARLSTELAEGLARLAADRARDAADKLADELVGAGKLRPCDRDFVAAFAASLDDDATVAFADGEATRRAAFGRWLAGLPKLVELKEVAPRDARAPAKVVAFKAPEGAFEVDEDRLELHRAALAHQEKTGCDYMTAVRAVAAA